MPKTIRSLGHEALRAALVALRQKAGLTQEDLAKRLHCHQSFVARVESGQRRIDIVELVVLARALQVDADIILESVKQATPLDHRI
ncbi:helix-turn-helix domain-containing protein [Roseinatronobacter monicus]|uniref:Helix-turn-helix protein n=1 Tax=Roseinatronobacter monicus TaxID=393481 RepID=A0A543KIL8_9RHOB|nr:helix-turn-helix transcriptional regulator [Roseinatronobacter monicus]TQM94904.1 helix-turn-helix protein [Roseinatronobacter monicus]